ncbi:MAG: FtsX-like permease family protein, partial [Cellulosilyticaceae bacterium]
VNWAYIGSEDKSVEPMAVVGIVGAILLIMFTGYLIIYNVFQISVMADIRFYGLLKTIGTTPKQIKHMIRRQAMYLSMIGIPIGLIIGYGIGNGLLPMIMNTSNIKIAKASTSPIIFLGAILFALLTVFISCRKPGKLAASISPIEASKYNEVAASKTKERKASKSTVLHMAYRNITRNKKKSVVVIASLALSLVLLNSVYTYTEGFDLDKYLSKQVVSDFILGSADYFNVNKHFRDEEDVPSEQYVDAVRNQKGVSDVGAIYYESNPLNESSTGRIIQMYGIQENLLDKLQVIEGSIDREKFMTGNYALEVVWTDDYGNVDSTSSDYALNEKVSVESKVVAQGEAVYEVMAKVAMPHNMGVRYSSWDENGSSKSFIVSEKSFKDYVVTPLVMAYHVEVEEGYDEQIETFLQSYTTEVEQEMDYESKKYFVDDFKGMKDMFFTVGLVASAIIGMVGIINFINVIFTSILSRRGEFAILQSIGMTTKQLRRILILEGILYAAITSGVVIILSVITSYFVVRPLCGGIWFFTYRFKFMPVILAIPCMFALGTLVPAFIQKIVGNQTVVERLRKMN